MVFYIIAYADSQKNEDAARSKVRQLFPGNMGGGQLQNELHDLKVSFIQINIFLDPKTTLQDWLVGPTYGTKWIKRKTRHPARRSLQKNWKSLLRNLQQSLIETHVQGQKSIRWSV